MTFTIENSFLQFEIYPKRASWNLSSPNHDDLFIQGARLGVSYRVGRARFRTDLLDAHEISGLRSIDSAQGKCQQINLFCNPDANGVSYTIEFALPYQYPLLMWKMSVENKSQQPVYIDRMEMLNIVATPNTNPRSEIRNLKSPRFFSNGWGSWDYSGTFGPSDRFRRTRLGPFTTPMRKNAGTPHPKDRGHFSSDMFGVLGNRDSRRGLLAGFLSQKEGFGTLETWLQKPVAALRMWANGDGARLDPGKSLTTDWACLHFLYIDDQDPLSPYLEAAAREHGIGNSAESVIWNSDSAITIPGSTIQKPIPTGWCSWYQFFSDVSEHDILQNLAKLIELRHELPLQVIQIDDGFETRVGDWCDFKPSFPEGLSPLADDIREAGFTPGIWLAPFIVDPRSRLARDHPDWLVRGRLNRPANAGFSSWGTFTAGLDLTHPGALAYVREVIHKAAHEWGFPYLKLDFLYAGALAGNRRDPSRTLAQVLRGGLEAIREAAGEETMILGCGCPLGSAIGLVDAMRINPDVDPHWLPNMFGFGAILKNEPGLPAARSAIHNTLTRAFMHQYWWQNDPDCLLLRPDTNLTLAETQSLATAIALSGGSLLLSDDLPNLPPERLYIAQAMLPLIGKRPQVMDWFDSSTPGRMRLDLEISSGTWHLLALFNWEDTAQNAQLVLEDYRLDPRKAYLAREFWSGEVHTIKGGALQFDEVPAHGVILLAVRQSIPGAPQYLGSNLHISQGLEVAQWQETPDGLHICIKRPGRAQGELVLALPDQPGEIQIDGEATPWRSSEEGDSCHVPVKFERETVIKVKY